MHSMNRKKAWKSLIVSVCSKLSIFLIGILLPRFILVSYGSEVNGLFGSINQIFSYVALLEAGIGTASLQALYSPISRNDKNEISEIVVATQNYFRKVTIFYFYCVVALSIALPFVISSSIPKLQIAVVVFLMGLSNVLTFWFTAALKQLMIANGESYFINNISLITTAFNAIAKIVLSLVLANIVWIQLFHLIINLSQILLYLIIFKRKYSWIDFSVNPKTNVLKQRKYFLFHEIAIVVFNSTDTVLLALFCGLSVVSKYNVYNMIFAAFNSLFTTVHNSVSFILGHAYSKNKESYAKLHDTFNTYFLSICFGLITVCYFLILPFVTLYTKGINDIEYYDINLPILFATISLLSVSRKNESFLINLSGHAKKTIPNVTIEVVINLVISIIGVNLFGVYGVLLGTVAALLYRTNDMIIYANKKILGRSIFKGYKSVLINFITFGVFVYFSTKFPLAFNSYFDFVKYGFLMLLIVLPVYLIINSIFSPRSFVSLVKTLTKKSS